MARPRQDGLLYFSFDTDFFYADKRIKRFHSKYGNDGLIFYIYLLTEIYRNGYYISWDEESAEDAAAELNLKEGFTEQVLTYLASRSLLTVSKLASSVTIITSPGIQKRYQEAKKGLKRQVEVNPEIWLLSKEETASCIKVTNNKSFSAKNMSKSEKNESKSEKNTTKGKENKGKENKEKNSLRIGRFEDFWEACPNKQRRYLAEKAYCDLIVSGNYTEGELITAAKNYAAYIRETGSKAFFPNNFLEKHVFEDYLETEYAATPKPEPREKPEQDLEPAGPEESRLAEQGWIDFSAMSDDEFENYLKKEAGTDV